MALVLGRTEHQYRLEACVGHGAISWLHCDPSAVNIGDFSEDIARLSQGFRTTDSRMRVRCNLAWGISHLE